MRQRCLRLYPDLVDSVPSVDVLHEWLENQKPLTCYYSDVPLSVYDISIDHKQPLSKGGTNDLSNLCVSSQDMNTAKGGLNEKEFKSLLKTINKWSKDSGDMFLARLRYGFYSKR
jgi:hypothetical protein